MDALSLHFVCLVPSSEALSDSFQMFHFLCSFSTAAHTSFVSKAVPEARSCLSAHSSLVLPIHFQDSELRYVCSFLYTSGLQLVCSEGPCWCSLCRAEAGSSWSRSCSAAQGVTQCASITAGDKRLSPRAWQQPVSSGLRNSQADAGEVALLRVCPFGAVGVNHNGKLETPVYWIL